MGRAGEADLVVRPALTSADYIAIYGWVQRWIVVHLQLAIELELARAGEGFTPEVIQTSGEVFALGFEDCKPFEVTLRVTLIGAGSLCFLTRMVDLERQNREPVDHEAGRLRVERRVRVGQLPRFQPA